MAYMRLYCGTDLGPYALVCAQQRHVTMRGAASDDLDHAGVIEMTKSGNDVAVQRAKIIKCLGKETMPEAGGFGQMGLARLDEVGLILASGYDFAAQVIRKLCSEAWVR